MTVLATDLQDSHPAPTWDHDRFGWPPGLMVCVSLSVHGVRCLQVLACGSALGQR